MTSSRMDGRSMSSSRWRRNVQAGATVLALIAGLTACSQIPESIAAGDDCVPLAQSGEAAAAVQALGVFGEDPAATAPTPLRADRVEVVRHGEGTGQSITEHGVFEAKVQVLSGVDGAEVVSYSPIRVNSAGDAVPATTEAIAARLPGVAEAVRCARAGERVVAVMPADAFFGEDQAAALSDPTIGIIAIIDVTKVYLSSAAGIVEGPKSGFPAVVTAPSGQPGVTVPKQAPPTELRSTLRVRGFGDEVAEGDLLTLHLSVFSWQSGEQLGSTWEAANGVLQLTAETEGAEDGLYGATNALVGLPAGSQAIIIVPAEQAQQFQGPVASANAGADDLVLVVDILAAESQE